MKIRFLFFLCLICFASCLNAASIYLRDNIKLAKTGDYIVTAQSKSYTLLHIVEKKNNLLSVEEITVPSETIKRDHFSWRGWILQGAPGHTSWILYTISLDNHEIKGCYSLSKNGWYAISCKEIFLPTLLNLRLIDIPKNERKRVGIPPDEGSPDFRPYWQPSVVVEGNQVKSVKFSAWRTLWPKDEGPLSGKTVELYLPEEFSNSYPSYFPYWIQVKGSIGKAQLRIVDSGTNLVSPIPPIPGHIAN